jgi:hypothetical protein
MAISITWATKVIYVPKSYMSVIQASPFEILQLDVNQFRLDLKDLEDNVDGMTFLDTHNHNTEITLSGVAYARIFEIINGYTVEFEDGQYGVTLYGANNNILDAKVANQVSVLANNSAGLINNEAVNDQSYLAGRVYIDTSGAGNPGTVFPKGTPPDAVDNWADALVIAGDRNLRQYDLFGTLTLTGTDDITSSHWWGNGIVTTAMVLGGGDTEGSIFQQLQLSGTADGRIAGVDCLVLSITGFSGALRECVLGGTLTIHSTNTLPIIFRNCMSGVAGVGTPVLDMNSANCPVSIRNYTGGLQIQNFDQGNNMSIDVLSGNIILDATCTSGTIVLRGDYALTDNSGPGCTVIMQGRSYEASTWSKKASDHAHTTELILKEKS